MAAAKILIVDDDPVICEPGGGRCWASNVHVAQTAAIRAGSAGPETSVQQASASRTQLRQA